MGFSDLVSDAGLTLLNNWVKTRSYIVGYTPSQADVKVFQQLKTVPAPEKYPFAWRWYNHILTWESEFSSLPGDPTKDHTAYGPEQTELPVNPAKAPAAEEEDDDEVDLFGSDDEVDEEAEKLKAERLAEYNKKKAGKVKPAAKSIVTMDVKPWDDETDLEQLKANVLAIEKDGLVWGASQFVTVGFGIKKLQINLVVEDDKVSTDELQQQIEEDEDHVQSTDIVAMQKL
ncbi:elongation factor 1 beta subunit [Karstenula rhodostoma CBS 690.94]|uniref:Elongation factor 1 beta subunit n=1 Tax=Karstenula rhodostoma CBS 690.94 TaxID=1392251 RepID=A0A9P4PQL2_9PLEO|nr:elongation factor 1 beta subunit [Karstenula rhodostoma CBS 690.94]